MGTFAVTTWNLQEKLGWEDQRPGVFEELRRAAGDKLGVIVLCDVFREIDTRTGRKTPIGESLARLSDFAGREGFETYFTLYDDKIPTLGYPGLQQSLAVLSRMPVLASKPVLLYSRNALRFTVEHEGEPICGTAAHLDSRSPFTRMGQVLKYLSERENSETTAVPGAELFISDANAPNLSDWRAKLLRTRPAQQLLHSPLVPYYGPRLADQARDSILRVMQHEAQLQDADPRHTPTMYGPGGFPYIQLDHILHGPALRTASFTVGNRGPSDHRWVQAELDFAV
ncbi:hypothetical protein EYC59_00990 [Candidatus Saccharibacteria bacterium]|nr:MAG: hypothetical protein EYC59_00990 [Candidatus Saccharibacteria bacterium]